MTDTPARHTPPSADEFEALARTALETIPAQLRQHIVDVVLRIEDFPDEETSEEMGLASEFDLLGLYRGVDLARRSVLDTPQELDMIFLYRQPILDYWCETGEDLAHVVRHVLIHEIGHHFGLSDADIEAIENEMGES